MKLAPYKLFESYDPEFADKRMSLLTLQDDIVSARYYNDKKDIIVFKSLKPIHAPHEIFINTQEENSYFCYNAKFLYRKIKNYGRCAPSRSPKFTRELFGPLLNLPSIIDYSDIPDGSKLSLEEALLIVDSRCVNVTDALVHVFDLEDDYYSVEQNSTNAVEFIKQMSKHLFYRDAYFRLTTEAEKEVILQEIKKDYDLKFIKHWRKYTKMDEAKFVCDHEFSDQYASDGLWYNSTGTCNKCLINEKDTFDSEECQDAYLHWQAAVDANKIKE